MKKILSLLLVLSFSATAATTSKAKETKDENKTLIKYLSGTDGEHTKQWDFYCSDGMNSGRWHKIGVPSCWEQQGFGAYTYGRYYTIKGGKAADETGIYRTSFVVPSEWKDRKIEIVFEGVMTDATVTVNGSKAGATHQGGFTSFSYDITQLAKVGKKNILEVKVAKQSADKSIVAAERKADWWLFGGIYRPVFLRSVPTKHIKRIAVDAREDGTANIELLTSQLTKDCSLRSWVTPLGNNDKGDIPTQTSALNDDTIHRVKTIFNGVKTWDPEHPNMYVLHLQLIDNDGKVAHETTTRIGFRTIEFKRRDGFYLNGKRLIVKGVNRHCFYPETGRTAVHRLDIEDLRIIKGMNANAIRSHYPPDASFLDLCDSLGVLYMDELPGWQNAYSTNVGLRIQREMITHDVNHPCIFVWSNGNEGGFNTAFDPMFAHYDPQKRHVIHAWALFDGVDCHHYPAYQTGVARLANGYEVFMPTEFLHAQYDKGAGASLQDFWNNYNSNPRFAGGFIWAYADEGVARSDRNGEIDTDGPNGPDGIVGPHREKEGSWYTIRDVWSPIQIEPMVVTPSFNGEIRVTNKSLFSSLSEMRMHYSVVTAPSPAAQRLEKGETIIEEGDITLPDITSECSGVAHIPTGKGMMQGDILRLVAKDVNGDTINVWTYPIKYADEYLASKGTLKENENIKEKTVSAEICDSIATLSGGGLTVTFSAASGMLTGVTYNSKKIPFTNGPLPAGMKMSLTNIKIGKDKDYPVLVMHYKGAADSIVWRVTPTGLLGMDALILNRRNGGGYEGKFFDSEAQNTGFSFSYPEKYSTGMKWLGRGPYRVWRNRVRGTNYGIWQKDYNNTITGESTSRLVYPEFKGYHGNMYWAMMESNEYPFTVFSETDGLYYRVFTPSEPIHRRKGEDTMKKFPEGDISFLLEIPAMRSYKPLEQLGPQAQAPNIRINAGDEGLHIKLWFDFRK